MLRSFVRSLSLSYKVSSKLSPIAQGSPKDGVRREQYHTYHVHHFRLRTRIQHQGTEVSLLFSRECSPIRSRISLSLIPISLSQTLCSDLRIRLLSRWVRARSRVSLCSLLTLACQCARFPPCMKVIEGIPLSTMFVCKRDQISLLSRSNS